MKQTQDEFRDAATLLHSAENRKLLPPMTPEQLEHVDACQQKLGVKLQRPELLLRALTHASSAPSRLGSNERMEFLGDAVLGFVCCDMLFEKYPQLPEGDLTQIKSVVVSRKTCTVICRRLGLDEFLIVGRGIGGRGGIPDSLFANMFESVVGAIYLDGGIETAREFLAPILHQEIANATAGKLEVNHKSALQQISQKRFQKPPEYQLSSECGPEHNKTFTVFAQVGKRKFTPATGATKKMAQQRAAANALAEIEGDAPPFEIE